MADEYTLCLECERGSQTPGELGQFTRKYWLFPDGTTVDLLPGRIPDKKPVLGNRIDRLKILIRDLTFDKSKKDVDRVRNLAATAIFGRFPDADPDQPASPFPRNNRQGLRERKCVMEHPAGNCPLVDGPGQRKWFALGPRNADIPEDLFRVGKDMRFEFSVIARVMYRDGNEDPLEDWQFAFDPEMDVRKGGGK